MAEIFFSYLAQQRGRQRWIAALSLAKCARYPAPGSTGCARRRSGAAHRLTPSSRITRVRRLREPASSAWCAGKIWGAPLRRPAARPEKEMPAIVFRQTECFGVACFAAARALAAEKRCAARGSAGRREAERPGVSRFGSSPFDTVARPFPAQHSATHIAENR